MPRPRAMTKTAPARPKTAPEAPTVRRVRLDDQRPEGAGEQRGEVEDEEARRPQRRLQQPPEDQQQEHVEADVDDAGVEEAAGDEAVPLAFGDGRAEEGEVDDELAAGVRRTARPPAGDLDQEDDDVDRDQDVGGRECARTPGVPVGLRTTFVRWLRALRAAHPDRGRGHAVGADRPAAGGAGDAGLAVGVAVTGLGHRARQPTIAADGGPQPRPSLRRRGRRRSCSCSASLGFFYDASFGGLDDYEEALGALQVNGWLNLFYVAVGAIGLLVAGVSSRTYALTRRRSSSRCWRSSAGGPARSTSSSACSAAGRRRRARLPRPKAQEPRAKPARQARVGRSRSAAAAAAQLQQHQRARWRRRRRRPRPPAAPSCAGRAAPAARSRRAPRPSRRAPRPRPG